MKVAILGAPGTGKTELARRLASNLNRDNSYIGVPTTMTTGRGGSIDPSIEKIRPRWKVVDGYVDDLAKRTGREYGVKGDIAHNIQIMAERWTREAEAIQKGCRTITCGSIYETMLYTAFTRLRPPVTEQELLQWNHEAKTSMEFLNLMEQMTFNYDVLLYLPLGEDKAKDTWDEVLDAKLPEVLEGCFRYAVPLNEPTLRQKVAHGLRVIRYVRDQSEAVEAEAAQAE